MAAAVRQRRVAWAHVGCSLREGRPHRRGRRGSYQGARAWKALYTSRPWTQRWLGTAFPNEAPIDSLASGLCRKRAFASKLRKLSAGRSMTDELQNACLRAFVITTLSYFPPPRAPWIFFRVSRFFCSPLTCCCISTMEDPSSVTEPSAPLPIPGNCASALR